MDMFGMVGDLFAWLVIAFAIIWAIAAMFVGFMKSCERNPERMDQAIIFIIGVTIGAALMRVMLT